MRYGPVKARFARLAKKRNTRQFLVTSRNELDETQELYYPPIMKTIAATDYTGYVGQEFSPRNGTDWAKSLGAAYLVCDV